MHPYLTHLGPDLTYIDALVYGYMHNCIIAHITYTHTWMIRPTQVHTHTSAVLRPERYRLIIISIHRPMHIHYTIDASCMHKYILHAYITCTQIIMHKDIHTDIGTLRVRVHCLDTCILHRRKKYMHCDAHM